MFIPTVPAARPGFAGLLGWLIGLGPFFACAPGTDTPDGERPEDDRHPSTAAFDRDRAQMVDRQLRARGIRDPRVLNVMGRLPRHEFVPSRVRRLSYDDRPLPIEAGQTISQPYIVALMTELARPDPEDRALDIGTGSGYQAAVLAKLVDHVYSIEIHQELADSARARLDRLGFDNVTVRHGDGYRGWPEAAPFDVIILAAAPPEVPPALIEQLAPGGRLVLPVGEGFAQELTVIEKHPDGQITRETVAPVAFVPMTGEARRPAPPNDNDNNKNDND